MYGDIVAVFIMYGQLIAIMNPFTAVNNFLTLTEGFERRQALYILRHAVLAVLLLGTVFVLAGRLILEFYHVSLASLRFGGGILLMYIAIDMLSGVPRTKAVEPGEVAVVPLATPMIIGPGTMTLLIHLGATHNPLLVLTAFLLAAATVALALRFSNYIRLILGKNGVKAMARFMSLIIAAVAANMIYSGVAAWYQQLVVKGKTLESLIPQP